MTEPAKSANQVVDELAEELADLRVERDTFLQTAQFHARKRREEAEENAELDEALEQAVQMANDNAAEIVRLQQQLADAEQQRRSEHVLIAGEVRRITDGLALAAEALAEATQRLAALSAGEQAKEPDVH